MKNRLRVEFARAMRNFRYERTPEGVFFTQPKVSFGGVFHYSVDGGPFVHAKNTVMLEGLDAMLSCYFNNGSPPTAFYLAPFTNNVEPSSALTAANISATLGEYTGYTEATRQVWTPNGDSSGQVVSSEDTPAVFTIGASAATLRGGLFVAGASAKGATTGKATAAALFPVGNTLNPGSTFKLWYSIGATPAA